MKQQPELNTGICYTESNFFLFICVDQLLILRFRKAALIAIRNDTQQITKEKIGYRFNNPACFLINGKRIAAGIFFKVLQSVA